MLKGETRGDVGTGADEGRPRERKEGGEKVLEKGKYLVEIIPKSGRNSGVIHYCWN